MVPRFIGPWIVTNKLDRVVLFICLRYEIERAANWDHLRIFPKLEKSSKRVEEAFWMLWRGVVAKRGVVGCHNELKGKFFCQSHSSSNWRIVRLPRNPRNVKMITLSKNSEFFKMTTLTTSMRMTILQAPWYMSRRRRLALLHPCPARE